MSTVGMRFASISSIIVLCFSASPVAAQDVLDEQTAIERALAREGITARDEADRAGANAEIDMIGPLENPNLVIVREGGGDTEWQLNVVQPIDLTGSRRAQRDAAEADALATGFDIDRRSQFLVSEVRAAYVRCAAGAADRDVWGGYVTQLKEAERVSTARAGAGDTAGYDVRRVRVQLSAAEAGLLRATGARSADCALLSALTGIEDPQVPLEAITSLDAATEIGERPDLVAQQQRIEAASYRVSAARRARFPQVSVGAGVRRIDDGLSTQYGPVVSVGVSLPIWNGGGAAVRRQEATRSSLEAELAIATRQIEAEQAAARARAMTAREAALVAIRSRDDARRLGTIADTAYQAGEIGVVELLDAYEAARDADLSVIALALEAALAAIEYDLTTGRTY